MARVHVRCWQETYRGLMPDAVFDDPGFPAARERMWTRILTSERSRRNRVAVAERDDELIGIAMSGPPEDATAAWMRQSVGDVTRACFSIRGGGRERSEERRVTQQRTSAELPGSPPVAPAAREGGGTG
jgi:hypothetical protein